MPFKKGDIPWNKDIPMSEKSKKKLCKSLKGRTVWNKDLSGSEYKSHYKNGFKGTFIKDFIPWNKGIPCSEEIKRKIGDANKGNPCPMKGKHHTLESRKKMSEAKKGELSPTWKGGKLPLRKIIEANFQYRQWRSDVFTRDEFTCQQCGQLGGKLNAHHIKPFMSIIQYYEITTLEESLECEELWNINNGITLCEECHKSIHEELKNNNQIEIFEKGDKNDRDKENYSTRICKRRIV